MSRRPWGLSRLFTVLAAAVTLVAAVITVPASAAPPAEDGPSSAACANRVNDTARKLLPCIRKDDLMRHMRAFQAIADANPGPDGHASRNSGEPGYKASVDYVAALMRAAGYDVTVQQYNFFYFAFTALPKLREVSPTPHDFTI